ncbi:MAG: hypothetical protein CL916_14195 [Deltaproteobacteria bacterium]|nr:hypothetical protein [Deltaproteobacteria bacterium]
MTFEPVGDGSTINRDAIDTCVTVNFDYENITRKDPQPTPKTPVLYTLALVTVVVQPALMFVGQWGKFDIGSYVRKVQACTFRQSKYEYFQHFRYLLLILGFSNWCLSSE